MMEKKRIWAIVVFATVFSLFAQTTVLQYETYLKLVQEQLPEMKLNATKVITAENNVRAAKGVNDVSLSAKSGAIGKQGSGYPNAANGFDIGLGADAIVSATGTQLSMQISQDAYFRSQDSGDDFYAPMVSVSVTQPLLRNVLGTLDRYPIQDAQTALIISKLQRQVDDASVFVSYKKLYFEWIMLEKLTSYFELSLKGAMDFENQINRRMQSGLADNDAYQNARRQTMQYKDFYEQYRESLKIVKTMVNYFVPIENKVPNMEGWNTFLYAAQRINLIPLMFDRTIYAEIANTMGIRAQDALKAMKNNVLPRLDLVGNASFASAYADGNYVSSFGDISNIDYFVGLRFSYPLGNEGAKAKLLEAQNSINAVVYESERIRKDYTVRMEKICSDFNTNNELLKSKKEQMAAMESRLATQLKKLEQGRIEADDIITTKLDIVKIQTEMLDLEYMIITAAFEYESLLALPLI